MILNFMILPIGNAFSKDWSPKSSISFNEIIPVNLDECNCTSALPFAYPLIVP